MVLSDKGEPLSTRWTSGLEQGHSARERLPLGQGGQASLLVNLSIDEMAPQGEVIVKVGVDGCEFLQGSHLSEPEHSPIPSSEGEMAVFNPIVQPLPHFLLLAQVTHCCWIGSESVGYDFCW